MDSFGLMAGIIGIGGGLYCFYAYYMMKKTGEINKTVLMSKDMERQQCKDTKGYIAEAGPIVLLLGIDALVYGAIEMVNQYLYPMGWQIMIGAMVLFFVILIWIAVKLNGLRKKYF